MSTKARLQDDLKQAMRDGDERRKSTIRMLLAAIRYAEDQKTGAGVAGPGVLTDKEIEQVITRDVKRRREAVDELARAGREERLAEEQAELRILEEYLPKQLTREEIAARAQAVIDEIGATGPAQAGEVMKRLAPALKGLADGRLVNEVVRELLAGR